MTDGHRRRLEDQQAARLAAMQRLSYLSPAIIAHSAITRLAGTDVERSRSFQQQVARYHGELQDLFKPLLMVRAQLHEPLAIPQFVFVDHTRPRALTAAALAALYLACVNVLLAGLALVRMKTPGGAA